MTERPHGLTRSKRGPDEHGTPGKGCRCAVCRQASNDHDTRRTRLTAYGRWQPLVDAGRARDHVRALGAQGVGWQETAALAGLSAGCVCRLLYGRDGKPPTRRVRPDTEAAILAVRPALRQLRDRAVVDAAGTRRRLQALARNGWPLAWADRQAGLARGECSEIMARSRVTAATARAVAAVYDEWWDKLPPEDTRERRAAVSRTRNRARRLGWAPVGAWDDEPGPHFIDDPDAKPAGTLWKRREAA